MRTYHNDQYTASILSSLCIDGITITHPADNTIFINGEVFGITGLQVAAIQGSEEIDITNSITTIPAVGTKLKNNGTVTVRIVYGMLETSYNINVISINKIEVTTLPDKTRYDVDESLDLTGIVVTGYNNDKTVSKIVTDDCAYSPAEGAILDEEGTHSVLVTYGGLNSSFSYTVQSAPAWDSRGMSYNSWDTIAWYIRNGQTSGKMTVGNTKQITTSDGKTITMQLVSINDGSGSAGQYYPDGTADFISVELIDSLQFSDSNSTSGWGESSCRTYLNNTRYNTLPSDVRQNIINKTHRYTVGGGNSFTELSDKIWLPTAWEMCGNNTGSYMQTYENANENKHYTIFANDDARKKKVINSNNYKYWWSSTNNKTNYNYYVCIANNNGLMSYSSQGMSGNFYTTLCFRIG